MLSNLVDKFIALSDQSQQRMSFVQRVFVLAVIVPILVAFSWGYLMLKTDLTKAELARRETIAYLAAVMVQEKLDRVVDVGVSLATRVQLRKLIEAGQWDGAVKLLEHTPKDFSYLDTVAIFDPKGILMAITPAIPEAIGLNFSYRDYYKGVSKNWKPYVSEVFKRAVEPKYNVVSVAIPIKSDAVREADQKILGILLMTIKLDTIFDWAREIEVGPEGFAYFVDPHGHVAGHPKFSAQDEVVDFSDVPVVQAVLKGQHGVGVFYNQVEKEERLSAYMPVPGYGWGVIVQQPTRTAFLELDENLRFAGALYGIIFIFIWFALFLIIRISRAMNLARQREKTFLEGIGDGLVAIDRSWNITLWNRAASVISGWSQEEAIGKPFRNVVKFFRKKDQAESITFIEEAMLYGKVRQMESDTIMVTKDGREVPVGDSASPIFDQDGKVKGAIIIFRDVSREQELVDKDKELVKVKDEFLFQTVHDLRAPSTIIRLIMSKFSDQKLLERYPELQEDVSLIQEANSRMLALIRDLLESAKGEMSGITLKRERVDIVKIVQGVAREMKAALVEKDVRIDYMPQAVLPNVLADGDKLKEVFTNLIDNGVKYNKKGGVITCTHAIEDKVLKTTIQDTGIGISRDNLAKLFTPYFRGDVGPDIQGTGLGLYIVKKLLEKMGGSISVISTVGQGTAFTVYLPIAAS